QRRLADPRVAAHDHDPTAVSRRVSKQGVQPGALQSTPIEHAADATCLRVPVITRRTAERRAARPAPALAQIPVISRGRARTGWRKLASSSQPTPVGTPKMSNAEQARSPASPALTPALPDPGAIITDGIAGHGASAPLPGDAMSAGPAQGHNAQP